MKKEIPILYSTPMVQAKLDGRKTQTRRILKQEWLRCLTVEDDYEKIIELAPWQPGDWLWGRETFGYEFGGEFLYKASHEHMQDVGGLIDHKWRPSIFMPKEAARIWDEVVSVRAERLQDITEEDAIAEGVGVGFQMNAGWPDYTRIKNGVCELTQDDARMSYATLWESINGRDSWKPNPWVWVITTKILSTTGKP